VSSHRPAISQNRTARPANGCAEKRLHELTHVTPSGSEPPAYRCQATQLFAASSRLTWWDVRQYVHDVRTGNHSLREATRVLCLAGNYQLMKAPFGYRVFRRFYGWMHQRLTGRPPPDIKGIIPQGTATPAESLDLEPGELVKVKQASEIGATLNVTNKNRGMSFDIEEVVYCGKTFPVRRRVTRIIDERSGHMLSMRSPCITLENVVCPGHYSEGRLLCPRAITPYWRESWLERAGPRREP
jgi:hypothetical protein